MAQIQLQLTQPEHDRLVELTNQIKEGLTHAQKGYNLIVPAMAEINNRQLWKEYGSFEVWAGETFQVGKRQVEYYLTAAKVNENVGDQLPITQAIALNNYRDKDQESILNEAKGSGEPITGKLIKDIAKKMQEQGRVEKTASAASREKGIKSRNFKTAMLALEKLEGSELADFFDKYFEKIADAELFILRELLNAEISQREGSGGA